MQIKNDEITVVLQGPIIQGETEKSISSIRTFLQGAKIILSTWQGSETKNLDVDEVVLNQDPSSYYCGTTLDNKKIFYNLNRQLLSTQNGIKRVHTKYTLKLRSDMYFTKDIQSSLLNYFDKFKERNSEYSFFKHRVIVGSLTSKLYSDSDERAFPLPFHVSDWFFFGLSTDIKDYFLDTTLLDEKEATKYPCIKYKIPVLIYNWKFPPEQYLCSEWLKRHIQFKFSDWSDWNIENVLLSEKVIANNFIVLDTIQHGLYSKKYSDLINDNDGEVYSFQGYISNLKFCELYKKYCDNNFKIASNLYYSRNNTYNKLVKKIRKYNNYSNSSFVKIFKIAIIKIKLLLLKKRIYLNLKKNKQKIKDKKYDLIIPCSNCRPTFHLKRFGLRTMALPLDYMCNFKLIDVCNLLRNDFKGFLYNVTIDKENDLKDSIYLSIINKEYNILCLYHYLKNANFSTEKNRVYELFQKRYHNLKQILDKGIFACIIVENENKEDIEYFLDVLSAKFSNSRFDIINVINDKTNSQLVEKIYFYNNSKITQYQFNDIYVGCYENIQYAGNTYYWRKILKKLKVSFQCCHKELHNVEESHSSCIQKIIDKIRGKKKYNVLSRVACLGGATVNSIKNINWLYNFQKNRIDCITDFNENLNSLINYDEAIKTIGVKDKDIKNMLKTCFKAQGVDFFSFDKVDLIIMDSFSELADKKFSHKKNGWSFFACYIDVKKDNEFWKQYSDNNLFSLDLLENYYTKFMEKVNCTYGKIPVYFIHFPTKYEHRELYIKRAMAINSAISKVCKHFPNLHSVNLEQSKVYQNDDGLTYHFDNRTVKNILNEIKKSIQIKVKNDD